MCCRKVDTTIKQGTVILMKGVHTAWTLLPLRLWQAQLLFGRCETLSDHGYVFPKRRNGASRGR